MLEYFKAEKEREDNFLAKGYEFDIDDSVALKKLE